MTDYTNGEISHWMHTTATGSPARAAAPSRRAELPTETQDLIIVGGGMTGLWAAYYAITEHPEWNITVLEAEEIGYGGSGRNGGWVSTLIPGNRAVYAKSVTRSGGDGRAAVREFQREMSDAITETLRVLQLEGIAADQHRGGQLQAATTPAALKRLQATYRANLENGYDPDALELLDAQQFRERIDITPALGGLFYRDTARVDPAKLTRGLADVVESRGVTIREGARVSEILPGAAVTSRGTLRGTTVLSCLEAFTGSVASTAPGFGKREVIPVNSSMIVTAPLSASDWQRIGWDGRECLNDGAHTFVYAQRTADDRIAIGGRGTPYAFNSGLPGTGEVDARTIRTLRERLAFFFPGVEFPIEHAWRGAIGVTRDWCAGITFDPATRIGNARGYAGHGVTATNLAARTLLDRAAGRSTPLTALPWNDHDSGLWEPEPIRWLGVHTMYRLFGVADAWEESRHSENTSLIARFGSRLAGLHE
ncbi:NAD(P)/FAD-dependent oxidoreductase [Leucobacter japonicus]|uniref:NAD(P)/FAD-dependent oxidoreductase n=1 Tax=Leucobacter japonicus TaxID=1461259 RepID=UPI000A621B1B|nr:FAD-dependent oxidoreductase [Leucobacter japonicus]